MEETPATRADVDGPLVPPERAAQYAGRWDDDTLAEYARLVKEAREWWEQWRREQRAGAGSAGIRLPELAGTFMPWDPDRLAAYMRHLTSERGQAPGTARKARAAILAWHRLHGAPIPDGEPASEVLKLAQRTRADAGIEPKRAEPLTLDEAIAILTAIDRTGPAGKRDAAIMLLAYAGLFMPAQLVALRLADVAAVPTGLHVAASPPRWVQHWTVDGQHHTALCPVETPLAWVRYLAGRGAPPTSHVLRPVDQHGHVAGLDEARSGNPVGDGPMNTRGLSTVLAGLLARSGIPNPQRFTWSSLKLGGAATLRVAGETVDQLAASTGTSLRSGRLLDYVRTAELWAPASTLRRGVPVVDVAGEPAE